MTEPHVRLSPRPYQAEALTRTAAAEERGVRRQLGVAATGLGKTVIFSMLAEQRGGRALILAHRDELVTQAAAKVREVWPGVQVGIVKAGENDVRAQVVVASVQTLARPRRLAQLLAPFSPDGTSLLGRADPFDLVVVDEAHHAAADTYRAILAALSAGEHGCPHAAAGIDHYHDRPATPDEVGDGCELGVAFDPCPGPSDGPLLLGVTATPDRGDGKGLDDLFDEVTWSYDILWGIRAGYLSDMRGMRVQLDALDLGNVKVRRGDYEAGAAGRAMEDAGAPELIVKAWREHAPARQTLVFTPTVEMARLVAEEFTTAGVAAAYVHGGTPLDERRQLLRNYSAGAIQVMANCAVLTEGYDEPRTDCIVVARPTKSRALYTQMVGRGTRRHPDKTDCLVLDVVGASAEHSLVTIPSLFGVEGKYAERLGDGSASASGVVEEWQQEEVRLGRLRAEEVQLFHQLRGEGIAWVQVHRDGELRRYVRPLGMGPADGDGKPTPLPTVVLAQRSADGWTAGLQMTDGTKRVLMADVPMEMAQGVAEDYVRKNGSAHLVTADAPWRARKPSPKALAAAKKWRLPVDPSWTAGQLSEALDAHIARIKSRGKAGVR